MKTSPNPPATHRVYRETAVLNREAHGVEIAAMGLSKPDGDLLRGLVVATTAARLNTLIDSFDDRVNRLNHPAAH